MPQTERVREFPLDPPSAAYFRGKIEQGWRLVSMDWERIVPDRKTSEASATEPIPFGLEIGADCQHLKENSYEKHVLIAMMDLIVKDRPLSEVAAELNRLGYRNRAGTDWTPGQLFDLLPRLIDVGPRILTNEEFIARAHPQTVSPR